jgi:Pyruvate/2-oxoglutarate dehydrogenase complex, dihydrolipoamide dehydrogenase (E3) component, and related enzymes
MKKFDYDLFVLGAGSGGVRASRIASSLGAKVGICEEDRVGGTCVIRGCIPKKLFVYASHYFEELEDSKAYGWDIKFNSFDWKVLLNNKNKEIDRLNNIYKKILSSNNVDLYEGKGVFVNNHTLKIGDKVITANKILIATGGKPYLPSIKGSDKVITSNEAFYLNELPKKIIIVGGGYIAIEFASIFNGLGCDVTIIYRGDQILRGFDDGIRNFLAQEIKKKDKIS